MGRIKMAKKENKKSKQNLKEVRRDKQFWMSMFILVIMVTSVAGFALMMTIGSPKADDNGDGIPSDVSLRTVEYQGQIFWVVIKNYEQFIFEEIDSFQNDTISEKIADQIKNKDELKIYVDPKSDNSASYLLEKLLKSLKINHYYTNESLCASDVLYISTEPIEGDCIKFIFNKSEQYQKANSIVYHTLK
jgi:hypothetical protein